MSYYTKADEIVGYTFGADHYCAECVIRVMGGDATVTPEVQLDALAISRGIDRYDEQTFDSDNFPKVIFASDADGLDACGYCGIRF